ncbi:MAG: alanyl-tRNA editing protein [Anaerovoracaceae bacterium]|jgi:alanyl-tRNA synthetase
METEKLYQQDVYLRECDARIISLKTAGDGRSEVQLDRTIFFPEGGGQSCDRGTLAGREVLDVQERETGIVHTIAAGGGSEPPLREGQTVRCLLDWPHRFDNMQRHCGEHILSGIFHRLYGGVNRGFHMGSDYMTIDIRLEDDPNYDKLTLDMALRAEAETNRVIWRNLPVRTRRFATRAEADAADLRLRKPLAIERDISIVCVGSFDNPSDCVACCGTHPATSGQVGLVKIYRVEKHKDMFRIYFEAGERALQAFDRAYDTLTELGGMFSAGPEDLLAKVRAQRDRDDALHRELTELRRQAAAQKAAEIAASEETIFRIDPLGPDEGQRIGRQVKKPFLALLAENAGTVLLFSDGSVDCGALVKASGLRGGGRPGSARASGTAEELRAFLDTLPVEPPQRA